MRMACATQFFLKNQISVPFLPTTVTRKGQSAGLQQETGKDLFSLSISLLRDFAYQCFRKMRTNTQLCPFLDSLVGRLQGKKKKKSNFLLWQRISLYSCHPNQDLPLAPWTDCLLFLPYILLKRQHKPCSNSSVCPCCSVIKVWQISFFLHLDFSRHS